MRRVLIISPHFPPVNAPDHQRVRMALPYFKENGWDVCVLAVDPAGVEGGVLDPFLETTFSPDTRVIRVVPIPVAWTRRLGVGSLALRSMAALRKAGDALLSKEAFDLVFVSTTLFPVMSLAVRWRRRYGIPYVLDFQDPWRSGYDYAAQKKRPPGGAIKYALSQTIAAWMEPGILRSAAHLVSVSPRYAEQWRRQYSFAARIPITVLPFGAPENDFTQLANTGAAAKTLPPGRRHWVYAGRGGEDMALALRSFFKALKIARDARPDVFGKLTVHFLGTDYAPAGRGRPTVAPIAAHEGVGDLVEEKTDRLPYGKTLAWIQAADALIVPGSDDAGYTASKIYPYILARKPLLAIFHESSSVVDVLRKSRSGEVVSFRRGEMPEAIAARISRAWFDGAFERTPSTDWKAFEPYTARAMTRTLCQVFDQAASVKAVR
jgi:hypothetical protein